MAFLLSAILLASPTPVTPPEPPSVSAISKPALRPGSVSLDLSSALSQAKTANPLLKAAKARVDERTGLIRTVKADALPQVTIMGDFTRVRDVSILNSGFGDSMAQFGINPSQLVAPRSVYTTQIMANQPLFYWGKIGTAVDIAKMGASEATFAYSASELEILHGVAKAYLAVLSTQAELEVLESREKTALRFKEDVKAKLEAQSATELDRLRSESEYLAVLPEKLQAQANHQRAMEVLCGQLGLDPKSELQLQDIAMPDLKEKPMAEKERYEISQFKQQEAMLKANEKIITSDLRPKFDLNAAYGYQAGQTDNLFKTPYDTWRVNVTMRFPIFDGLRSSGKKAQNRAQMEQVRQLRVDRERSIAVEQSSAEREVNKAIAFVEAAQKAHDAGFEALRMSRESFELGLITSLDLLQAERLERQLESQRRRAQLGLLAALFDQRKSLGLAPLQ